MRKQNPINITSLVRSAKKQKQKRVDRGLDSENGTVSISASYLDTQDAIAII